MEILRMKKYLGYRVVPLPSKYMADYEWMNHYAAQVMRFRPLPKAKEIFIDKHYRGEKRREIIKHEIKEAETMRTKGFGYIRAHKIALKNEHTPFKRLLKR